ncbi:MAG: hypothetical protein ACJ76Z_07370 [Thermoleophilaceae bacterium]
MYGCDRRRDSLVRLGRLFRPGLENARTIGRYSFAVAGEFVAYVVATVALGHDEPHAADVRVVDLRKRTRSDPGGKNGAGCSGYAVSVDALVAASTGAIAWICVSGDSRGSVIEVWKSGARGDVLLDESADTDAPSDGPQIGQYSLALSGYGPTVYWTKGGAAYSAPLD